MGSLTGESPPSQRQERDNGTNGTNGATNVVVHTSTLSTGSGGGVTDGIASCGPGEVAVGGGVGPSDGSVSGSDHAITSFPTGSTGSPTPAGSTPVAWTGGDFAAGAESITTYVICASP